MWPPSVNRRGVAAFRKNRAATWGRPYRDFPDCPIYLLQEAGASPTFLPAFFIEAS